MKSLETNVCVLSLPGLSPPPPSHSGSESVLSSLPTGGVGRGTGLKAKIIYRFPGLGFQKLNTLGPRRTESLWYTEQKFEGKNKGRKISGPKLEEDSSE